MKWLNFINDIDRSIPEKQLGNQAVVTQMVHKFDFA